MVPGKLCYEIVYHDFELHRTYKTWLMADNKDEAEEEFYKGQLPGVQIMDIHLYKK